MHPHPHLQCLLLHLRKVCLAAHVLRTCHQMFLWRTVIMNGLLKGIVPWRRCLALKLTTLEIMELGVANIWSQVNQIVLTLQQRLRWSWMRLHRQLGAPIHGVTLTLAIATLRMLPLATTSLEL
jgi:hypothetical protein